jgi:hypothetical protein
MWSSGREIRGRTKGGHNYDSIELHLRHICCKLNGSLCVTEKASTRKAEDGPHRDETIMCIIAQPLNTWIHCINVMRLTYFHITKHFLFVWIVVWTSARGGLLSAAMIASANMAYTLPQQTRVFSLSVCVWEYVHTFKPCCFNAKPSKYLCAFSSAIANPCTSHHVNVTCVVKHCQRTPCTTALLVSFFLGSFSRFGSGNTRDLKFVQRDENLLVRHHP